MPEYIAGKLLGDLRIPVKMNTRLDTRENAYIIGTEYTDDVIVRFSMLEQCKILKRIGNPDQGFLDWDFIDPALETNVYVLTQNLTTKLFFLTKTHLETIEKIISTKPIPKGD